MDVNEWAKVIAKGLEITDAERSEFGIQPPSHMSLLYLAIEKLLYRVEYLEARVRELEKE